MKPIEVAKEIDKKSTKQRIKSLMTRLWQYAVSCRAFFDRNYNLLFNGKNCIKIKFYEEWFKYNDIVTEGTNNLRCLGKCWYVRHGG